MGPGPRLRGVGCRRASARRHRERPTAAPAPPHLPRWKEKARLLRTPLRQGRLFGGTGQRGGVELPGAAGVVGTQKAATPATGLHSLVLCFCLWGGLRRTVAAVAGVGLRTVRPCAGEVGGTATTHERPRAHDQWRGNPTAKAPAATPNASTAAVEARQPERPCLFASRTLRVRPPSPSAAGRSAADAPGPPKHLGSLRGVRRYRRIASRLRSGAPTACGHQGLDSGGGREADQV